MGGALASNSRAVAVPASENNGSWGPEALSPTSTSPLRTLPLAIIDPSRCKAKGYAEHPRLTSKARVEWARPRRSWRMIAVAGIR